MKTRTIPSGWLQQEGRRLDSGPYLSGGLEARLRLEGLSIRKQPLRELTAGFDGGIFNGPHFSRVFVTDPALGVPFLGSAAMLQADLSGLPLLRKRDATSPKLAYLQIQPGMTLISCSGTIGRMVYARADMAGMWSSQHIMKVVPDILKIPAGYLYAYLSGKFGIPLIVSGTYGSIIQSIEPHQIADVPIPRFGETIERRVHELVEESAQKRYKASKRITEAISELEEVAGLPCLQRVANPTPSSINFVHSSAIQRRMDAFFHSLYHDVVVNALSKGKIPVRPVSEFADSIIEPIRFKRRPMESSHYGVPFFGTSALLWTDPTPIYFLPKTQSSISNYIVGKNCVLIPRSGQLSGLIGTAILPYGDIVGSAVTEDAIRIYVNDEQLAGFVFIALSSKYGLRQLKARAHGSSIPHLDVHDIGRVLIPDPGPKQRAAIGQAGMEAADARSEAILLERKARALVERAIEEAT